MKAYIFLMVFGLLLSFSPANGQQIETDYLEAIAISREQEKGLLFLFMDTDTKSKSSKEFSRNFLDSKDLELLHSKFVILKVDCSASTGPDSIEAVYCKRLTTIHNKDRQFPAILATDEQNQKIGELQTDFSKDATEAYIKFLKSI